MRHEDSPVTSILRCRGSAIDYSQKEETTSEPTSQEAGEVEKIVMDKRAVHWASRAFPAGSIVHVHGPEAGRAYPLGSQIASPAMGTM